MANDNVDLRVRLEPNQQGTLRILNDLSRYDVRVLSISLQRHEAEDELILSLSLRGQLTTDNLLQRLSRHQDVIEIS